MTSPFASGMTLARVGRRGEAPVGGRLRASIAPIPADSFGTAWRSESSMEAWRASGLWCDQLFRHLHLDVLPPHVSEEQRYDGISRRMTMTISGMGDRRRRPRASPLGLEMMAR